jgi:nitrate reductase NapD
VSILGVIARTRPADAESVRGWLKAFAGVEIAVDPGDGRFILVIEDSELLPAEVAMAEIALNPQVINVSLAYEYSDEGALSRSAPDGFARWRSGLKDLIVPA